MLGTIKNKHVCQTNWRLAHLKWIAILHYCEVENCGNESHAYVYQVVMFMGSGATGQAMICVVWSLWCQSFCSSKLYPASLEEDTIYLYWASGYIAVGQSEKEEGGREGWPMVGRREVEVRDDGPMVPQASYSYSECMFAIRKSEKGVSQGQSTKSGPKPQLLPWPLGLNLQSLKMRRMEVKGWWIEREKRV